MFKKKKQYKKKYKKNKKLDLKKVMLVMLLVYLSFSCTYIIETRKQAGEQLQHKEDWDSSVRGKNESTDYETKLANKIAEEILKRSKVLRNIHSKKSIKAMIGDEAKRFLNLENI